MLKTAKFGELFVSLDQETFFPAYNVGRENEESWGEPSSIAHMLVNGFELHHGCVLAYPIESLPADADGVRGKERAIKERRQLVDTLRETPQKYFRSKSEKSNGVDYIVADTDDAGNEKQVKHRVTCLEAADELENAKPPKFWVYSAQRRTVSEVWARCLAVKMGLSKDLNYVVQVKDFVDLDDMYAEQVRDNRADAKQDYSEAAFLQLGIRALRVNPFLKEQGLGEAIGLRDTIDPKTQKVAKNGSKRGARQKVFAWATLETEIDGLNIAERVFMSPVVVDKVIQYVVGGYIPVNKLDKELGRILSGRSKPNAVTLEILPEFNTTLAVDADGNATTLRVVEEDKDKRRCATAEEMETVFKALINGTKAKNSMLSKQQLESVAKKTNVVKTERPVGEVLTAILAGDQKYFTSLGNVKE